MTKNNKKVVANTLACIANCGVTKKPAKIVKNPSQVIRLGEGQSAKLSALSESMGVTQAQLVRWAVEALVNKVEQTGGKLTLPFDLGKG